MLVDFRITIHSDPRRVVRVVVHENERALRSAVTQRGRLHDSRRRRTPAAEKGLLGVCERFHHEVPLGKGKNRTWVPAPLVAIVRLAPPDIGIGIVSHELAHAAVHIWNLDHPGEVLDDGNDEDFAWNLGELVRQTVNKLYEKGIYPS